MLLPQGGILLQGSREVHASTGSTLLMRSVELLEGPPSPALAREAYALHTFRTSFQPARSLDGLRGEAVSVAKDRHRPATKSATSTCGLFLCASSFGVTSLYLPRPTQRTPQSPTFNRPCYRGCLPGCYQHLRVMRPLPSIHRSTAKVTFCFIRHNNWGAV